MPEIRKHYFLDEYCIIAAERRKRPSDSREQNPLLRMKKAALFAQATRI